MMVMKFKTRVVGLWLCLFVSGFLFFILKTREDKHERFIREDQHNQERQSSHLGFIRKKLVKSNYTSHNALSRPINSELKASHNEAENSYKQNNDPLDDHTQDFYITDSNHSGTTISAMKRPKMRRRKRKHYKFPKNLKPYIVVHPNEKYSEDFRELDDIDDDRLSAMREELRRRSAKLRLYTEPPGSQMTSWELFHNRISQYQLYSEDDGVVDRVLNDMATLPITGVEMLTSGTQLKLIFTLEDDGEVLFKPKRLNITHENDPNLLYYAIYERHNSEIAAFHLDRILGFRRTPPAVGRILNITRDVYRLAGSSLKKTFYVSPVNNVCFFAKCDYFCDSRHPVCGDPVNRLEGSFALFLPPEERAERKTWKHPYKRSYSRHSVADWQLDPSYCMTQVRKEPPYDKGRRLLDVIDMVILDFLLGNMDRHHYEMWYWKVFNSNDTYPVNLDNGRGFGRLEDEMSILLPIQHCCVIRYSTLRRLRAFHRGPYHLSDLMRQSLLKDPLKNILTEKHLQGLDRRVKLILNAVHRCLQTSKDFNEVVIDDLR